MNSGAEDGQQCLNYNRPSNTGIYNMTQSKNKYRMKRPYSMITNLDYTNQNLNSFSGRRFKNQCSEGVREYNQAFNPNSVDSKKNLPVFSMNTQRYKGTDSSTYNTGDIDMSTYNQTSNRNNALIQSERIEKIKSEMANYQSQMKRADNTGLNYYECCDK